MTTENIAELQPAPVMRPTIVRRVVPGGVETLERQMEDERALCVFWSLKDAQRAMLEAGCPPDAGWKAVERDHEQLRLAMDLLAKVSDVSSIYLEAPPNWPDLSGLFEPDAFIAMLEDSERA